MSRLSLPTTGPAALLDRRRSPRSRWSVTGAVLGVVASSAALLDSVGPDDPEPAGAEATYSSASTADGPADSVLWKPAVRIAEALRTPGAVAPSLSAEVTSIDSTGSGWLLLVTTDALLPDDAADLCAALADAGALPRTRVFVADARRHLVRSC